MEECELSSLELYESDWVCVKTGIFETNNDKNSFVGKCNFGKKGRENQKSSKLKFFCGWNPDKETVAVSAREGKVRGQGEVKVEKGQVLSGLVKNGQGEYGHWSMRRKHDCMK